MAMVDFLTTIAVVLLACSNIMTCCKVSEQEKRIKQLEKFNSYLHSSNEEHRCNYCEDRDNCPAYMTGVLFPCPGYKEADDGKQK